MFSEKWDIETILSQMSYNDNRISDDFIKEAVVSIVEEALTLKPIERLHLVDELLLSLDIPTKEIDLLWAEEAEKRLEAYNLGEVKTLSSQEVFAKYRL